MRAKRARGLDSLPAHHIFRVVTGFLRLGFLHRSRIEPFRAISNCSRTPQRRDHSLLLAWHAHTPAVSAPGQHDPVDRPPTGLTSQHEEPRFKHASRKAPLKDSFSSLLAYSADMNGIRRFYALPDRNAECSHRIFGRVLLCEQIPSAVPAPNSLPESGDARLSRQEG